jgi:hypothetical protein
LGRRKSSIDLTPVQVARILNVRLDTVLRRFGKEPGVIDMTAKDKRSRAVGGDACFGFHVEC